MRHRAWTLLLLLLPVLGLASPAIPVPPFSASYMVSRNGFEIGETQVSLVAHEDGKFTYEALTSPTGLLALLASAQVHERSWWVVHDDHPRPLKYVYRRVIGNKERNVQLSFDWTRRTVTNNVAGSTWSMEIPDGTLDKLVVQLALMMDLDEASRPLEYRIADGGKLKTYRFRVVGTERLQTPIGTFETLKVEREHGSRARATVMWCAPALHYLPLRVDQREKDGERFLMTIQSLEGLRAGGPTVTPAPNLRSSAG